jgi:hypothetical protein
VVGAQHGTATVSGDGESVSFLPALGYSGDASFQFVADDGYGTSAPATVTVHVSAAPLVNIDFQQRTPHLNLGDLRQLALTGDFTDQKGVALPASYLTFQTTDPTVASVSAGGELSALADGITVLLAGSHGIQAATALTVGFPQDQTQQDLYVVGLDTYPQALALAPDVTRQMKITLQGQTDLAAASAGTRYFVSNPAVLSVTPDGLVTGLAPGVATLTVIDGPAETVVPVEVQAPRPSGASLGAGGGVVQGADGTLLMVAPGALQASTPVSLTPMSVAAAPLPAPHGLQFLSGFQLDVGSQPLAVTAQLAAPFPGLAAGTNVYLMRAGQIPDDSGQLVPTWFEVEKAVVGADGVARTTSPPYSGVVDRGS